MQGWRVLAVAPILMMPGAAAVAQTAPAPVVAVPAAPRVAPDPYAAWIKASGTMDYHGRPVRVDLLVNGHEAAIRARAGAAVEMRPITTADMAILLLLDRRLEFLWPALLDWAGPDLGRFRAFSVADAEAAYNNGELRAPPRTTAESSTRPKTRRLFQYSEALWFAGYRDKARALVDTARAETGLRTDWDRTEWTMLSARLASYTDNAGQHDDAIKLLIEAKATLGADSPYAINFDINRAAYLAEAGRSAEALALIETLAPQFETKKDGKYGKGGEKVPGSERQFAWIKACALSGLGRAEEATRALAPVLNERQARDPDFVVTPNAAIRQRAYVCMKQVDGVVRELLAEMDEVLVAPRALYWMTPGATPAGLDPAMLAAVRADPRMKAAMAGRLRPLPAELTPALNGWAGPS
jgi:hypothetical protein